MSLEFLSRQQQQQQMQPPPPPQPYQQQAQPPPPPQLFQQQFVPQPRPQFAPYQPAQSTPKPSQYLLDWEKKTLLKRHAIPSYDGRINPYKWFQQVEHYASLLGLDEAGLIERARAAFTPDVLEWFSEMSRAEHHPLSWAALKQRLITRFASAFSTQQLWHQLASLQRGKDINEYHRRFIELIHLVGETPSSVFPGSQAFNIYEEKMDPVARHTWSVIALQAKFTNQTLSLRHIMMVAEEEFEKIAAGLPSVSISRSGVVAAAALPADPAAVPGAGCATTTNAMRSRVSSDRCARCDVKGHWAH